MRRTFSYRDAVRLLGGQQSAVVAALDKIVGGVLLGVGVGVPDVLSLFAAKTEFVRLSQDLIASLADRRSSVRRYDRTQRLEAAHTVLVVTAFFETVADLDLPFRWRELRLRRNDQEKIFARVLVEPGLIPTPQSSYERNLREINEYYGGVVGEFVRFVQGLDVWDRLNDRHRRRFAEETQTAPERACRRYEELFRQFVADFPEVACWASLVEHQSTRAEVRQLNKGLLGLEQRLKEIAGGRAPNDRRESLSRAYRARLDRPVLDSDEFPHGIRIPSLAAAYIDPRFRVANVQPGQTPSSESWWDGVILRSDVHGFLAGYLTSSQAVQAPMLVLGQPGSGKSKLTQVLAARLPPADFLPVRVALRDVPAEADLQEQIERAVRSTIGESVSWPDLSRSAGDALPVVLLDGFDELLQATGVSQTDYLVKVFDFQRREADQGRPVAVLVTSRTAVADRARIPQQTVALRLEPFDRDQVERWLEMWNETNTALLAEHGLLPLTVEVALAWPELAEQPLLLTMMALYDADSNVLQHSTAVEIGHSELYEQLMTQFARRQIIKQRPDLSEHDLDRVVEVELHRLSVAAFAMFNRGTQWVTTSDLDRDLTALVDTSSALASTRTMRAPLSAAEVTIGRFFFIHQARAQRDDQRLETYEFLHATFSEFLIARLVWRVIRGMMVRESATTWSPLDSGVIDDSLLHAVLSFAPLSLRVPIVRFLDEMAVGISSEERRALAALLVSLFRRVHERRPERHFASYEPAPLPVPARHAAYSANLVLLAVLVSGEVRGSTLFGTTSDVIQLWHAETLLWRSQFNRADEWTSLVKIFALQRLWEGDRRDIILCIDDGEFTTPPIDPYWTYSLSGRPNEKYVSYSFPTQQAELLLRKAHFACGLDEDVLSHTIEPFARYLRQTVNSFMSWWPDGFPSAAHALLCLTLEPPDYSDTQKRAEMYLKCIRVGIHNVLPRGSVEQCQYLSLVVNLMSIDSTVSASALVEALRLVDGDHVSPATSLSCVLVALNRDPSVPGHILADLLIKLAETWKRGSNLHIPETQLEMWIKLGELGLHDHTGQRVPWTNPELLKILNLPELALSRPDLVRRARQLWDELYSSNRMQWPKLPSR